MTLTVCDKQGHREALFAEHAERQSTVSSHVLQGEEKRLLSLHFHRVNRLSHKYITLQSGEFIVPKS